MDKCIQNLLQDVDSVEFSVDDVKITIQKNMTMGSKRGHKMTRFVKTWVETVMEKDHIVSFKYKNEVVVKASAIKLCFKDRATCDRKTKNAAIYQIQEAIASLEHHEVIGGHVDADTLSPLREHVLKLVVE